MESVTHVLGIDASKKKLLFHLDSPAGPSERRETANDAAVIAQAMAWLKTKPGKLAVAIEPTSRYHRGIARALWESGAELVLLNPRCAHHLAQGLGANLKSEPSDAKFLAKARKVIDDAPTPAPSDVLVRLKDLSRAIEATIEAAARMKKSLEGLEPGGPAYEAIRRNVQALEKLAAEHEKAWRGLLASDPEAERRYELLRSDPGVGPRVALTLVSELPADLSPYRLDQVCAYAGVVPRERESGERSAEAAVGKTGNAHIRTVMFLPALLTAQRSESERKFYAALRAKGRTHKQATIALVHRLLRTCVSVLKRGTPWTEEPPGTQKKKPVSADDPLTC